MSDKIKCTHILVEKQSQALAVLDRLKKGEKFAELAKELSLDTGSGKRGGDLYMEIGRASCRERV